MPLAHIAADLFFLAQETGQGVPPAPDSGDGGASTPWILIGVAAVAVLLGLVVLLRRLR